MARQVLPINQMVANVFLDVEGLPLVPVPADGCIVAAGINENTMLVVTQTDAAVHDITIKSIYGSDDDYVVEIGATTGAQNLLFETQDYEITSGDDIGKVYVDFETGFVGTIYALGTLK